MFLPFVSLPSANITTSASITFCWHSIRMMRRFACHVFAALSPLCSLRLVLGLDVRLWVFRFSAPRQRTGSGIESESTNAITLI